MKISEETVCALQKVITGDPLGFEKDSIASYRSGPELVSFFNQFGENDVYGSGFPSRWSYAESKIWKYNDTEIVKQIIEYAVDPRHYFNSDFSVENAVKYLNKYLEYDGYRLSKIGKSYQLIEYSDTGIEVGSLFTESEDLNKRFIQEQLEKCERKLGEGDFTGAITNSRSLIEAVLREIEERISDKPPRFDGNLSKLYKRVYNLMNLDPSQNGISNAAREILSGLISIISGLAPLRNKASDAHAPEYSPYKHHAELAVNVSKTIVKFLVDSLEYQFNQNLIELTKKNIRDED